MKNKILSILIIFFSTELYSKDLLIEAKSITIDKDKKVTLFQNNVVVRQRINKLQVSLLNMIKKNRKLF